MPTMKSQWDAHNQRPTRNTPARLLQWPRVAAAEVRPAAACTPCPVTASRIWGRADSPVVACTPHA